MSVVVTSDELLAAARRIHNLGCLDLMQGEKCTHEVTMYSAEALEAQAAFGVDEEAGRWQFSVWVPEALILNSNDRKHWGHRSTNTPPLQQLAVYAARPLRIPPLRKARVEMWVAYPRRRQRDVYNLYPTAKAMVDGLVKISHLLPDDDDEHLVGPDMRPGGITGEARYRFDFVVTGVPRSA